MVALVRPTSRIESLTEIGVECRTVDLNDRRAVDGAMQGVTEVFHLAAAYREELADRTEFQRVNVDATENLLAAAASGGVQRFVHCSTVGVHGQIDHPPAAESYRFQPGDHYQESKLAGERRALGYAATGLPVTVVRPVGIYGPGDLRFLKLFRSIHRRRFVMVGSGRTLYHLTYIDDLVTGFLLAGRCPAAVGQAFIIAGPRYTTLNELVRLIARELGRPQPGLRVPFWPVYAAAVLCEGICRPLGISPPLYRRRTEFFSKDRAFDTGKARALLGYAPQVDLEEGIRRTAAWYRNAGLL